MSHMRRHGRTLRPLGTLVLAVALAAGCGGDDGDRESLTQVYGSTAAPDQLDRPTQAPPDAAGKFPPLFHPEQGDPYWSVIVAYAEEDPDAPSLQEAEQAVRAIGYDIEGPTDAGCLRGAESVIDMGDDFKLIYAVELSFATEEQARTFERNFGQDIAGIAQVNGSCLD